VGHIIKYGHSYGTVEEYQYRLQLYTAADKIIQRVNSDPEMTWTAEHNMFSTMNEAEKKNMMGYLGP
jgi:hypothetical protein